MTADHEGQGLPTEHVVGVVLPSGIVVPGPLTAERAAQIATDAVLGKYGGRTEVPADARCRICSCTNQKSCPGGCVWVDDPDGRGHLCSACWVREWPMSEAEALAVCRQVAEMNQDPSTPAATVSMKPFEAFLLVGGLQAVIRHPDIAGSQLEAILRDFGRQVQALFGADVWRLLEMGWHRDFDVQGQQP